MSTNLKNSLITLLIISLSIGIFLGTIFGTWYLIKKCSIWSAGITGQAQLRQATYSKQVMVQEALAKEAAAIELAKAEVSRAEGVAKANKIIGESLNNNQSYLTYLWIQNLENSRNQVIYVPTETNLPILEANRIRAKQ